MAPNAHADYRAALREQWPAVRRAFNYPLVDAVRLATRADDEGSGATRGGYRWATNEVVVSAAYLDALDPADGDDLADLAWTIETHELGHYACFPRDLSTHLVVFRRAEDAFGPERGYPIYAQYANVCTDLRLLADGLAGANLLALRERTAAAVGNDERRSKAARRIGRRIQRLAAGLYAATFDALDASVDLSPDERETVDALRDVDYFAESRADHERNVVRFGRALQDALPTPSEAAIPGLEAPEDDGKAGYEHPFGGEDLERVPEAELDDALSDVLREEGKWTYELVQEFLEERAAFDDPYEEAVGGGAGIAREEFATHDGELAFYRRWAAGFPVYVAERPLPASEAGRYRSGRRPYEASDPVRRTNVFASRGLVGVPGVSQVDRMREGAVDTEASGVPDLLVGIDSSGSMPAPDEESHAVLAAFVLANTYYRSGARVGAYNFGTDVAFLPPGRDLAAFQSLACGRWGGGTVVNGREVGRFLAAASEAGDEPGGTRVRFSDEEAYRGALERLPRGEPDAAEARSNAPTANPGFDGAVAGSGSDAPLDDAAAAAFERLDHVLITDGAVANEAELLDYLDAVAARTRNFVFLTDPDARERWAERDLPDTWVYAADDADDLTSLALGLARDVAGTNPAAGDGERPSDDA